MALCVTNDPANEVSLSLDGLVISPQADTFIHNDPPFIYKMASYIDASVCTCFQLLNYKTFILV